MFRLYESQMKCEECAETRNIAGLDEQRPIEQKILNAFVQFQDKHNHGVASLFIRKNLNVFKNISPELEEALLKVR